MPTREQIVAEARTWLGVPWRHQGRDRVAIDCAGLLELVGKATGAINYTGPKDYRRESDGTKFLRHFARAGCREKSTALAKDGDILVFLVQDGALPRHCGIRSTRNGIPSFIHSYGAPNWRKVVEDSLAGIWATHLVAVWEYPNIVGD